MSQKILFIEDQATKAETTLLKREELRLKLRACMQEKFPSKSPEEIMAMVPADVEEMTYQQALLLAGLSTESALRNHDSNAEIALTDLVSQDFGVGQDTLLVTLVGMTGFKPNAICVVDMNAGTGKILCDYVTGDKLRERLAAGGLAPASNRGMTPRDVVNLIRVEQKLDLSNNPLSDYKSKQPIVMDKPIDERIVLNSTTAITWIAAKPIEGNII